MLRTLLILLLAGVFLAGCGGPMSRRVDPDSDDSLGGTGPESADARTVAREMALSMLNCPEIALATTPPTVAILPVRNGTSFHIDTSMFTTRIQAPLDYGLGAVFGVTYMLIMIVLLIGYRRVIRNSEKYSTVTGKGFRPRVTSIGRWRWPAFSMFVIYFFIAVVAPFVILAWTSFLPGYRIPSVSAFPLLTFSNYIELFETDRVFDMMWNTLYLMLVTATITMLFAFVTSWGIVRSQVKAAGMLDSFVFIPHAIPGIVIALALIMAYLSPPLRYLGIYGTMTILVMGLVVSYISFGTRLMNSAIMQIQKELEQAAYVAGAGTMRTMFSITLPLLFPAFAAGWIWVAVHALRSFSIPIMLASRDTEVFAVLLWEYWDEGSAALASALGVLMIMVLIPMTLLMRRFITQISEQR